MQPTDHFLQDKNSIIRLLAVLELPVLGRIKLPQNFLGHSDSCSYLNILRIYEPHRETMETETWVLLL